MTGRPSKRDIEDRLAELHDLAAAHGGEGSDDEGIVVEVYETDGQDRSDDPAFRWPLGEP